jgi:NAD(P)-dependent dehydrogenase (short-subunit alcohol dehydrogenase family)
MPDPVRTVIVTGASSGIGAACARALATEGYQVILVGRSAERLSEVRASMRQPDGGPAHHQVICDVSDATEVKDAAQAIGELIGAPFGLVNSAGVCIPAALESLRYRDWVETINVNLSGTFLVSQAVALMMLRGGVAGSIVNIGSEASMLGMPGYIAYCSSKAGLMGLTKSMAAELAPSIRVNLLCPGPVDTPMLRAEIALSGNSDLAWAQEVARVPLRRLGTAEETAAAAAWLLGTATFATGTVLSLDGGTTVAGYASGMTES